MQTRTFILKSEKGWFFADIGADQNFMRKAGDQRFRVGETLRKQPTGVFTKNEAGGVYSCGSEGRCRGRWLRVWKCVYFAQRGTCNGLKNGIKKTAARKTPGRCSVTPICHKNQRIQTGLLHLQWFPFRTDRTERRTICGGRLPRGFRPRL